MGFSVPEKACMSEMYLGHLNKDPQAQREQSVGLLSGHWLPSLSATNCQLLGLGLQA